jgi:hypothetical protein
MSKRERVNSQLCVTLPTFVIIALRVMVEDANRQHPESAWTVSRLLESFLLQALRKEKRTLFEEIALKSPDFKRAAEAWLKSEGARAMRRHRQRQRR